jgi:hypothetical protein
MTKKQIMEKAVECADLFGLKGVDRFNYIAQVQEGEDYKNAPETEPALREELEKEVRKILDQCNSLEGFFSNPNRIKK